MKEAKYKIGRLSNSKWAAASSSEPFFCFVGTTKAGVIAKAEIALNDYVRLGRSGQRSHSPTQRFSISRLSGETRQLAVG